MHGELLEADTVYQTGAKGALVRRTTYATTKKNEVIPAKLSRNKGIFDSEPDEQFQG